MGRSEAPLAELGRVFREEAGLITGALTRVLGSFDIAEDAVQEALARAAERWPKKACRASREPGSPPSRAMPPSIAFAANAGDVLLVLYLMFNEG